MPRGRVKGAAGANRWDSTRDDQLAIQVHDQIFWAKLPIFDNQFDNEDVRDIISNSNIINESWY